MAQGATANVAAHTDNGFLDMHTSVPCGGPGEYGYDSDDGEAGWMGGDDEGAASHDGHEGSFESAPMDATPGMPGLVGDGLVAAPRAVQKIDIKYATAAKRVDVKELKGALWGHIKREARVKNEVLPSDDMDAENDTASAETPSHGATLGSHEHGKDADKKRDVADQLSFRSVVHDLAPDVPTNITVPFYFICVLHLANEKVQIR